MAEAEIRLARRITYGMSEAKDLLAGYMLGERSNGLPLFAYRTYDCIPPGPGPALSDVDLLVIGGFNARPTVRTIGSLLGVRKPVSEALGDLVERCKVPFWEVDRDELRDLDDAWHGGTLAERRSSSRLWGLYEAWRILITAPAIRVAVTHKVLHHKLPSLAPLVDGKTCPVLEEAARASGLSSEWAQIHKDLAEQADEFRDLERFVGQLLEASSTEGSRPLNRLRIHDILTWCETVKPNRSLAIERGKDLRKGDLGIAW